LPFHNPIVFTGDCPVIAERKLLYINNPSSTKIVIKVGIYAPYRPAITKGFEHMAGCIVHTGTETAGEHEVLGIDPMQALCKGLTTIDFYLKALSTQGALTWDDGGPYQPSDAPFPIEMGEVFAATVGTTPEDIKKNVERFKRFLANE
jgi:hypothetical protein